MISNLSTGVNLPTHINFQASTSGIVVNPDEIKAHIYALIAKAKSINLKKSVIGTFAVMMEACIYYSKEKCHIKQINIGYSNKHKPLKVRQTKTHQKNLVDLGMFRREERINRRLPYEHYASDLGIVYYLLYVKFITDPWEILQAFARIKKLHLEQTKNCTSQGRSYKRDKDLSVFNKSKGTEMKSKSLFANTLKAQCETEEAAEKATEELKAKYPSYPTDYDKICEYRTEHAALVQKFLHPPKAVASPMPAKQPKPHWYDNR